MLVLSRMIDETVVITLPSTPMPGGTRIILRIIEVRGNKTRIGIAAPAEITIHRGEIQKEIDNASK